MGVSTHPPPPHHPPHPHPNPRARLAAPTHQYPLSTDTRCPRRVCAREQGVSLLFFLLSPALSRLFVVDRGSATGPPSMSLCKMSRADGGGGCGCATCEAWVRGGWGVLFLLAHAPTCARMFAVCEWASLLRSSPLGTFESGGSSFLRIVRGAVLFRLGLSHVNQSPRDCMAFGGGSRAQSSASLAPVLFC